MKGLVQRGFGFGGGRAAPSQPTTASALSASRMNLGTSGPSASPPRWCGRRLPAVLAGSASPAPNYAKNALHTLCLGYTAARAPSKACS